MFIRLLTGESQEAKVMVSNKKVCLENNILNANTDRISDLPDDVLQQILSFLDIKHAVQTCVLSRRWYDVWTNVPCLNIKFKPCPHEAASVIQEQWEAFVNFVRQVLYRRCSSDIYKCSVYLDHAFDDSKFRSFLDYSLMHNVQTLEITYRSVFFDAYIHRLCKDPYEMPRLVFNSKSLRVLKLTALREGDISLPKTLRFITLKELHLEKISLRDKATNRELIPDCPNLEYFSLVSCEFGDPMSLKITAPQLTNLEICDPKMPERCNVIVAAPNLSCFKYSHHLPLVCSMGNPLNIDTVNIDIWKKNKKKRAIDYKHELSNRMIAMLHEFQHAKSVTLSLRAVKFLSPFSGVLTGMEPPFYNLKNFKLNIRDTSLCRGLKYILQNSPHEEKTGFNSSFWFIMDDKPF